MSTPSSLRRALSRPLGILILGSVLIGASHLLVSAQNFVGPSGAAGTGQGAIGLDSSYNLAVGTSTPQSDTKLLIVGTSTGSGYFAIKVLNANNQPTFIVRSDGSVSIGGGQIFNATSGATTTIPGVGNAPSTGGLFVNGPIFSTLDIKANGLALGTTTPQSGNNAFIGGDLTVGGSINGGSFGSTVNAANVTAGTFGAGNFAFPASLGINTSTQVGLPANLTVYGTVQATGQATFVNASATRLTLSDYLVAGTSTFTNLNLTNVSGTSGGFTSYIYSASASSSNVSSTNVTVGGYLRVTGQTTLASASGTSLGLTGVAYHLASTTVGTTTANNAIFYVATSAPMLYVGSNGRVGIATTTPTNPLSVQGNANISGTLTVGSCSGCGGGTVAAANVTAGVFGAGNFAFPSSLGIGTSTQVGLPQALSVYGSGYYSSALAVGTTTAPALINGGISLAVGGINIPTIALRSNLTRQSNEITTDGNGFYFDIAGNPVATNQAYNWRIGQTNSSYGALATRMRLTSTGSLTITASTTGWPLILRGGTSDDTQYLFVGYDLAGSDRFHIRNDGAVAIAATTTATALALYGGTSDNTQYAFIANDKSGIARFHVRNDGAATIVATTTATGLSIYGGTNDNTLYAFLAYDKSGVGRFHVRNDGAVIIVATTTATGLTVYGGTADNTTNALLVVDKNSGSLFNIRNDGYVGIQNSSPSGLLQVSSSIFFVSASGNVGIGTAAPATTLDINGALTLRGTSAPAPSSGNGVLYYNSSVGDLRISKSGGTYASIQGGYAGTTASAFTGSQGGFAGANANCAAQWPGSHMCTCTELMVKAGGANIGATGQTNYWVRSDFTQNNGGYFCHKIALGVADCANFSSNSAGQSGETFNWNAAPNTFTSSTCNNSWQNECCY